MKQGENPLEEANEPFEPLIVVTAVGAYYLNERGDWGVAANAGSTDGFKTVSTDADRYNAMCRDRQAAWADYLAALRAKRSATA